MGSTSVGNAESDNELDNNSHGSDGMGNKTLGESVQPALPDAGLHLDKADQVMPDGPNVGPSPWEEQAAEGKLPDVG